MIKNIQIIACVRKSGKAYFVNGKLCIKMFLEPEYSFHHQDILVDLARRIEYLRGLVEMLVVEREIGYLSKNVVPVEEGLSMDLRAENPLKEMYHIPFCVNCYTKGHRRQECVNEKQIKCASCGMRDVTLDDCSECRWKYPKPQEKSMTTRGKLPNVGKYGLEPLVGFLSDSVTPETVDLGLDCDQKCAPGVDQNTEHSKNVRYFEESESQHSEGMLNRVREFVSFETTKLESLMVQKAELRGSSKSKVVSKIRRCSFGSIFKSQKEGFIKSVPDIPILVSCAQRCMITCLLPPFESAQLASMPWDPGICNGHQFGIGTKTLSGSV